MKYKIAIMGDSISQGIGSKKINYVEPLQNCLGKQYVIKNFAHTGTTINYAIDKIDEIKNFSPDIILVMYGNVDAQIRPNIYNDNIFCNIIPKRYKLNGMLDPRPFYSKKWYRILPDRVDNLNRKIIRKLVVKTQGTCQWISNDKFKNKYQKFLNEVSKEGRKIILVSTIKLDENNYPGCTQEYKKFNRIIEELAIINNYTYIDLFGYIEEQLKVCRWNDLFYFDHYHPNSNGYKLIGELFAKEILKLI